MDNITSYNQMVQMMKLRRWPEVIRLADVVRADGISRRDVYEGVLSAYIESGATKRVERAAREYARHFSKGGYVGDWGAPDGVAWFFLGRAAYTAGDWQKAKEYFAAAGKDASMPAWYKGAVYSSDALLHSQLGAEEASARLYLEACRYKDLAHGLASTYSNYLFQLNYTFDSPDHMLEAAKGYDALFSGSNPYQFSVTALRRRYAERRKIRIGYISPDLRSHVVASFSYAFLCCYDKKRFEVYCYTDCIEDDVSHTFANHVDQWRNVRGLSDPQIAEVVYKDELDILVDLAGHTAWNFLPVLAFRPAPVQVSGIGYFATTGLSTVDYFLADHYTDPEASDNRWFVERLLKLPQSHFCYHWHGSPSDQPADAPCLRRGYVTFGSLNNFAKVNDQVLAVWAEILRRVPQSRLYLKATLFAHPYGRRITEKRMIAQGIDPRRIIFAAHEKAYLHAYHDIDIALDPFPYPGGGTTCDALYMGVPVVTLVGKRHGARFGYSLLMNLGLAELCASTQEAYIEIAVALAKDTERLHAYHQNLRPMMQRSPMMQPETYMSALERAYTDIWQNYLATKMPREELLTGKGSDKLTSIVILSYNTKDYLRHCIASIRRYTAPGSYEMIIIDNASTDGSAKWLCEEQARSMDLRVVFNRENVGFPKGCNQGMAVAKGRDILLLNSDTIVTPRYLEQMRTALYADEHNGAVSCAANHISNFQQVETDGYTDLAGLERFAEGYNHTDPSKWERRTMLVGFCFLLRRSTYEQLGGFDETFSPGNFEDADYSMRLLQAGYHLIYAGDTFIHHFGSASFAKRNKEKTIDKNHKYESILMRNRRKFLAKWDVPWYFRRMSEQDFRQMQAAKHPDGHWQLDENKICFIACVNDAAQYDEALASWKRLRVPPGMTVESLVVSEAASMTEGYQQAMEGSDAKYKIYLHQDVWITDADFLVTLVREFRQHQEYGLAGAVGVRRMPGNGIWWEGKKLGSIRDQLTGELRDYRYQVDPVHSQQAAAVDGLLLATQYDVPWRTDLFAGWHFYDLSQAYEFRRLGFQTVVLPQSGPLCTHYSVKPSVEGFEEDRQRFVQEYAAELAEDAAHVKPLG